MIRNEPIRILLADDDADDQLMFREAFEGIKIKTQVEMVRNGAELMNHLLTPVTPLPHILFLDLNMPLKSGIDCLKDIRKIQFLANIAIVIYSTSSADHDIEESFIHGANVYLRKPNDFVTLRKLLAEVVIINWQYQAGGMNRDNFILSL